MEPEVLVLLAHFDARQGSRLRQALETEGARVLVASDGPEALSLGRQHAPQLALLSTLLPQLSGFEVCRQLCQNGGSAAPPVVLLSDVEDPYVRARARHVGAKRVVVEPVENETLSTLLAMRWDRVNPVDESFSAPPSGRPDALLHDLTHDDRSGGVLAKLSDPLTGLVNEEYLRLKTQEECKRAARYRQPLSMLIAEIDNIEQIVTRHGRRAGDEALLEVAGVFLCESRDVDVAGRVRQAQFQLLMPSTPREGAQVAAARIHESLSERRLVLGNEEVDLVVSLGLATLCGHNMVAEDLVRQAESDLAVARRRGTVPVAPLSTGDTARGG